jgi:hypothetical protein
VKPGGVPNDRSPVIGGRVPGIHGCAWRTVGALRRFVPVLACVLLAGCQALPEVTAAVAGGAAGGASGNPAVGFAVAVATDAAANYVVRYYGRSRQQAEQDAIAQIAGLLPPGTSASWRIEHDIPIGNEHGLLRVVDLVDSPLASCKRIMFSVDEGKREAPERSWYRAEICRQADRWKWATAEPAVERWGFLH